MIWQNPWAWLGLATVALPVIIHLFGRGHARVHRFPTLRFIAASRLLPTRRTRLNDLPLLVVRASAVAAAVAALARPLLLTPRRSAAANTALARIVIVDTSAHPDRAVIDSVIRATHVGDGATAVTTISTADVSSALPGAVAWLETRAMRGEIAIVSPFQDGTIDSLDVASLPARIGVRLIRVPSVATAPLGLRARSGDAETITRADVSPDRTDAQWSVATKTRVAAPALEILAGANERRGVDAARLAAASVPIALPIDSTSLIAVVEPGSEARAERLAKAIVPQHDWMMDVVARVAANPSLVEAARRATIVAADTGRTLVVVRTDDGRAVVLAGEDTIQGRDRLDLYSLTDAGSLTSAALLVAVAQATSRAPAMRAIEPATIPDATLTAWQRVPGAQQRPRGAATRSDTDESDGRWPWLVVLALLAVETWLRRTRATAGTSQEFAHDRAA